MSFKCTFNEISRKAHVIAALRTSRRTIRNCATHSRYGICVLQSNVHRLPLVSSKSAYTKSLLDTGQRKVHSEAATEEQKQSSYDQEKRAVDKPVPYEILIDALQNCSSVKDQMRTLCSSLALTEEDVKERISFCNSIYDMLRPFFHEFKVNLFGSTINGLGIKGCDIDMVFRTSVDRNQLMATSFDDSDIPSIEDVLSGKVSPTKMSTLSGIDQLLFIHTVFLDYYQHSTVAPLFIKAYVPIIRFHHDRYELKCDLSTGNQSAITNTKLLLLLTKLDERVLPLAMAIRYWGKHVGLIGGGLMFNSYTITLLVIYFLQTRTPPVLLPVEYLLEHCESLTSDIYDESVLNDVSKIPPSENTQTLEELFREFFFYYLYFDFKEVICPAKACSVPREQFTAFENNKKFRVSTICVQDPIKLTHNTANLVEYKNCRKFGIEMLFAAKLFQDETVWSPKLEPWGLTALFSKPDNYNFTIDNGKSWTFNIPVKSTISKAENKLYRLVDTAEAVMKVLQHCLLFKCNVSRSDNVKILENEINPLLLSIKCSGEHNTWLGRNSVKLNGIQPDGVKDCLNQEHLISQELCKRRDNEDDEGEKKRHFKFICNCYAANENDDTSLLVKLVAVNNTVNPVLGIFLKEYLPRIISKLLF